MKKLYFLIVIAIILLAGWQYLNRPNQPTDQIASLPEFDPKNCTYQTDGQTVTLTDGRSEIEQTNSSAMITTQYFGNSVEADFDHDGRLDSAFVATQETGGSGTFYLAMVALNTAQGCKGFSDLIGDRIAPQNTDYHNEMITFNYADRKAGEDFSVQPSIALSKYYKIIEGQLRPVVPPLPYEESEAMIYIKQILTDKYPAYAETLQINVRQETNEYAVGAISFEEGAAGGQYLAVKQNGNWQLIYEGNGSLDCSAIRRDYNFPEEMLEGFCD